MGYETQSISSCVFFFFFGKILERFFAIFTCCSYSLAELHKHAKRKVACIFLVNFSSKLPMKLWNFNKKAATADKKNISKHDRIEYSQLTFTEKNHVYNLCFCSQKECQKCIFRLSGDLNFKIFFFTVHPGDTSWDSELSKL